MDNDTSKPGLNPSNSTSATALSGSVMVVLMYFLSVKGITFPAGVESAISIIVCTVIGYIPKSGRV